MVRILFPTAKSQRTIGSAVWESTRARFRGAGCQVCFGSQSVSEVDVETILASLYPGLPLYRRRIDEQELIAAGKLKGGHRAFGFWPCEGYC